jgi:hydrogenase nickel incorporation protein HypA/HybF
MHEISLMEQTLALALDYAQQHHASRIHRFKLTVGKLSGVVPEALAFAFETVIQGTIAEGAQLEIKTVAVTCYCPHCQQAFQPETWVYDCPQCGEISTQVVDGRQMELTSLEIS